MSPADDQDDPKGKPDKLSNDEVREAIHELRNCLHAIHIGLALLAKSRDDAERFNNLLEKVVAEQQLAVKQLDRLAK